MRSSIAREVHALNLPEPGEVVVASGAAMELYGIRPAGDIDLVVSKANFAYLKALGWTLARRGQSEHASVHALSDPTGRFDVWTGWFDAWRPTGQKDRSFEQVRLRSVRSEHGFFVMNIDYLLELKQASARAKDEADVRLLQAYLKKHN